MFGICRNIASEYVSLIYSPVSAVTMLFVSPSWQTRRKSSKYNIAAYPSHILNNGIILNMSTPHMPLFQIGVTFFEYAAWIYSGMSAVASCDDNQSGFVLNLLGILEGSSKKRSSKRKDHCGH